MRIVAGCILIAGLLVAASSAGCRQEETPIPPPTEPPSTQPLVPPPPVGGPATCKAPHDGYLLPIGDGLGYIEWDVSTGRLYCLDQTCKPLSGVRNVSLYVKSPKGPVELATHDCGDAAYGGSCLTVEGSALRRAEASGVLRFELGGTRCRVVLAAPVLETQPSGIKLPLEYKRPGS